MHAGVLDSAPYLTSLRMRIDAPDSTDNRDFRVINSSVLHRLPSLLVLQNLDVTVPRRDDGSARAVSLAVASAMTSQLQSIGIHFDSMSDGLNSSSAATLVEHLEVASTVTSLDLSQNELSSSDCDAAIPAIARLTKLQRLKLFQCNTMTKSFTFLAHAFTAMRSLTHVELPGLSNWHPVSINSLVHSFSMLHKLQCVMLLDFDQLYQRSLLSAISVATELTELQLSCKYTLSGTEHADISALIPSPVSTFAWMHVFFPP
jgi:Leucine-rich repeat (LRR) protein